MPEFRPPYAFLFIPPVAQSGSPGIADREDFPPRGGWFVHLNASASAPSSASVLRSFGAESQPMDDVRRRLLTRPSQLSVATSINVRNPFFFTTGVFASARTSAVFRFFVEEFDARHAFVRGVSIPGELVVVREDFWWLGGSRTFPPAASGFGLALPTLPFAFTAQPNFFYRVWVDLVVDISAQGFGGIGGSGAIAQLAWDIEFIDILFT